MEDGDASEIRMANRATVVVEIVKRWVDDDLEISSERVHPSDLFLITDFIEIADSGSD
jgi:hypothetical protein